MDADRAEIIPDREEMDADQEEIIPDQEEMMIDRVGMNFSCLLMNIYPVNYGFSPAANHFCQGIC